MSQTQYIQARRDSFLFAKFRALTLGVSPAQVELFELAYLRQVATAARGVA